MTYLEPLGPVCIKCMATTLQVVRLCVVKYQMKSDFLPEEAFLGSGWNGLTVCGLRKLLLKITSTLPLPGLKLWADIKWASFGEHKE